VGTQYDANKQVIKQAKEHRLIAKIIQLGKQSKWAKLPPYNATIRIAGSELRSLKRNR